MISNFKLIDGIPGWPQNFLVIQAELNDEGILFKSSPIGKAKTITLRYEQITGIESMLHDEIIEKSKSVVGRGIVGSLFGAPGMILGGMSGIGTKQKKIRDVYYLIQFISAAGEPAMITLGTNVSGCNAAEFRDELKTHITAPAQEYL